MKIPAFCVIALAMAASAFGQANIPAAPSLTAGAQFKGLRFDWNRVPGAVWYQLEYRAHQTGAFLQQGDDLPATASSTRFSFPLHLFDWTYARYRLAACNSAGCSRSAAVSVSLLRRDAVGYFKAAAPVRDARFGADIDLSPDGYNFVAAAPNELKNLSSNYVDGGAVYVFQRGPGGKWLQRVRLDAQAHVEIYDEISLRVATSGNGNTVAVGMVNFEHSPYDGRYGQVDVYQFKNDLWSRTSLPYTSFYSFGSTVALSESGSVLAVGLRDNDNSVAIYRNVDGVWQNARNLPIATIAGGKESCHDALLSRDGKTIAELCGVFGDATGPRRQYIRMYSGNNWSVRTEIDLGTGDSHVGFAMDRTGDTIALQFSRSSGEEGVGFVKVFKRGNGAYAPVATLNPGPWRSTFYQFVHGYDISVSGDGHTIAVGDGGDNGRGWGPRAAPLLAGSEATGAVYVYRLTDTWKLANVVKPNYNPNPGQAHMFGQLTALSQTGKTLIVGAPTENSSAQGIDGDWANSNLELSGAVFMY